MIYFWLFDKKVQQVWAVLFYILPSSFVHFALTFMSFLCVSMCVCVRLSVYTCMHICVHPLSTRMHCQVKELVYKTTSEEQTDKQKRCKNRKDEHRGSGGHRNRWPTDTRAGWYVYFKFESSLTGQRPQLTHVHPSRDSRVTLCHCPSAVELARIFFSVCVFFFFLGICYIVSHTFSVLDIRSCIICAIVMYKCMLSELFLTS